MKYKAILRTLILEKFLKDGSEWLSLLHNFIPQSINPGSAQAQILLAVCRWFAKVEPLVNVMTEC